MTESSGAANKLRAGFVPVVHHPAEWDCSRVQLRAHDVRREVDQSYQSWRRRSGSALNLVFRRSSPRAATVDGMSRPTPSRRRRRRLALVLAAVAIGLVVVEPFPKGEVLLSLTRRHGVDTGDIPALVMLLIAACLAV